MTSETWNLPNPNDEIGQHRRRVDDAAQAIGARCALVPEVGIILGSGLGGLAEKIDESTRIAFGEIPGFMTSTASGHRGELILGRLGPAAVVAMAGRFHRYEGWSNDEVTFPVHVMAALGSKRLIVSNAAGGVNPKLRVGDIVVIRDHLNWMGGGCRRAPVGPGPSLDRRGDVYDPRMSLAAMAAARKHDFVATEGTYLATLGPNYETRSEYRMMRRIGVDVVGMSTVPEVLAASELGLRVLGLSMVSNVSSPDVAVTADHEEVLNAGKAAESKMEKIVRGVLDGEC